MPTPIPTNWDQMGHTATGQMLEPPQLFKTRPLLRATGLAEADEPDCAHAKVAAERDIARAIAR